LGIIYFPLCYPSFRMWQFHNRIKGLWLGGWWWSLEILKATKFGKQISMGLNGDMGREHLIISRPLNAHCVFVFGGVSSMGLVRAWVAHVKFLGSLSTPWIIVKSFLATFPIDLKTSLAMGHIKVFIFCEDGSFWFAKHCYWKLMRERSKWYSPHRILKLNFYLIRVMSVWTCEGALIIRFDDSIDYSSYMDCVHGYGCLMWRDFLVPLFPSTPFCELHSFIEVLSFTHFIFQITHTLNNGTIVIVVSIGAVVRRSYSSHNWQYQKDYHVPPYISLKTPNTTSSLIRT